MQRLSEGQLKRARHLLSHTGDYVERALKAAGITKERVERWVGGPCGCKERQEKLNAVGAWAASFLDGGATAQHLEAIMLTKEELKKAIDLALNAIPAKPGLHVLVAAVRFLVDDTPFLDLLLAALNKK